MLTKKFHWIVALIVVFVATAFWALTLPKEVHASKPISVKADNSCLSCHEDLYYLHDTGCWYCMSEPHKDRCVDCHEGSPSATKEEQAHVGLVKHPQENNGAKCMECHTPDDAQMRMAKFESIQGFDTVIRAEAYTPSQPVKTGFPDVEKPGTIRENLGWLVFAFLMFGAWLILALKS